ncbi:MAG: hypothetical protein IPK82_18600 [Polyangiaceae bacterium]|nr:hypothetical protein [Polyangiaceae bacterium]
MRARLPSRTVGAAARRVALGATLLAAAPTCQVLVSDKPANVKCVEDGAVGPPACPVGSYCRDGACEPGPPALGQPCDDDAECAPGDRCFDPAAVGVPGDPLCSRPCCSSSDCDGGTGLVCAVLGPGKMCAPARDWERADPGEKPAGAPCETHAECRSGECRAERYCADACCSDAECAPFGAACADSGEGWMCTPVPSPKKGYLELCLNDDECLSGLCFTSPDSKQRCAKPCCSSDECGAVKIGDLLQPITCLPIVHGAAMVLACAGMPKGEANRPVGAPCDDPSQCRGGRCIENPSGGTKCAPTFAAQMSRAVQLTCIHARQGALCRRTRAWEASRPRLGLTCSAPQGDGPFVGSGRSGFYASAI